MQSQLGIRRQRVRYPVVALLMLVAVTIGCGDSGPKVSDANKLFIEAGKLIGEGQKETALEKLNESIAAEPLLWSYRERAKLLLEIGKDDAAMKDVDAALQLAPDDPDLLWLKGEIAKPAAQRFQGRFKSPPSSNR
jgi:tetratricopeptide (TPR) repeat protein